MKRTPHVIRVSVVLLLGASLAALAGCRDDDDTDEPAVEAQIAEGREQGRELAQLLEQDLGDPTTAPPEEVIGKIAAVTEALHAGEIMHAELALDRAERTDARLLAQHMLDDHTAMLERQETLLARLGMETIATPARTRLEQEAQNVHVRLEAARAGRFDADFAMAQVRMHAAGDELLGRVIPWPDDGEFETYLVEVRDAVREHLDLAIAIAEELHGER